jgi:transcriptional regulator GlxA family with amidase domain
MREIPVYFLLLPGYLLMELAGAAEALRIAQRFGGRFKLHYISPDAAPVNSLGLAMSGAQPLPAVLPDEAWLVIPGLASEMASQHSAAGARAQRWLGATWRAPVQLITICSGALLAAGAGLLNGRRCTTHHSLVPQLRALAPTARVEENRIFVIDGEIATSAGVSTGCDLILEMLSRTLGPRAALEVAREMVVWLRRDGDSPQHSPFLSFRNHLHPAVHRAQDAIAANPARDWPLAELARIACVTPRHLGRLFKANAGLTPVDYRQRLQIGLVEGLLDQHELTMDRLAEAAGFGSARDLRRVWLKQRGLPLQRH